MAIVLMSDFGTADGYVAAMKGVIASVCPEVPILDATHDIPPQDIAAGAWALANYLPYYPEGTIHVAVVDPGVGTERDLVLVEAGGQRVFAPDNGLLGLWLGRASPAGRVRRLRRGWHRPGHPSTTFHGRDILAYAAAMLAAHLLPDDVLEEATGPLVRLPESEVVRHGGSLTGYVVHIDRFGNAITGVTSSDLQGAELCMSGKVMLPDGTCLAIKETYGHAALGASLALINSSDHLEIAVSGGSAANTHSLVRGSAVEIRRR